MAAGHCTRPASPSQTEAVSEINRCLRQISTISVSRHASVAMLFCEAISTQKAGCFETGTRRAYAELVDRASVGRSARSELRSLCAAGATSAHSAGPRTWKAATNKKRISAGKSEIQEALDAFPTVAVVGLSCAPLYLHRLRQQPRRFRRRLLAWLLP